MEMKDYLRRQFIYDAWANREVLTGLRENDAPAKRALQLMAHILAAKLLWLERLQQQSQTLPVWPEFSLQECEAQAEKIAGLWRAYLDHLSSSQLEQTIQYKNTQGQPWSSTVHDIMTHVLMHGAYHRGQIAAVVRAGGQTPAYTDFIHAVRQGMID